MERRYRQIKRIEDLKGNFNFCMRALGNIKGCIDTNALESFQYWYKRGMRIFETDIDQAADGKYVACHELTKKTLTRIGITNIPNEITSEWFLKQKIYKDKTGGLTPLSLDDILDLAEKYPDIFIMLDPRLYTYKQSYNFLIYLSNKISKKEDVQKRIIYETYNQEMIRATQEFPDLLIYQYCIGDDLPVFIQDKGEDIYDMRMCDINYIIKYLRANKIRVVSYPWKYAVEHLCDLKKLTDSEFVVFSKTRNDIIVDLVKKVGVDVNVLQYKVNILQRLKLIPFSVKYHKKYKKEIDKLS